MKEFRKFKYFGRNSIGLEISYLPMAQIGLKLGEEHVTLSLGFLIQFYFTADFRKISSLIYKYKLINRDLNFNVWFSEGVSISISLFSDWTSGKKGDWKWYWNLSDKLKGRYKVSKEIVKEIDILIPMPEKAYQAHAVLADWTWKYPRWFPKTVRRCEIEIPEGLPHAGKGENSWDCGDDATYSMTTGRVRNIPEAVGKLVGSVLNDRVRHGGWEDWEWTREKKEMKENLEKKVKLSLYLFMAEILNGSGEMKKGAIDKYAKRIMGEVLEEKKEKDATMEECSKKRKNPQ